jgi:2-polyprenyl-3-methyl-5-hydroxy-6-metoxy-1,4-benzoquinol methylase
MESPDMTDSAARCPCCLVGKMQVFYESLNVPTNSCILLPTREEAKAYPTGDIRLGLCPSCGFISNRAFDPALTEYSGRYEETQAFSPTFNAFQEGLAKSLVDRYGLQRKDIIEIGCGKGEFLSLLCQLGENRGLGFDPGYSEARGDRSGSSQIRVIKDFFSEKYRSHRADFVACKMTLEHIPDPYRFVDAVVALVRSPNGVLFIQVPESLRILRECAFEDIYYEHCSYFTGGSLARLLERVGLMVSRIAVEYDAQYLTVEAVPSTPGTTQHQIVQDDLGDIQQQVESFTRRNDEKRAVWSSRLKKWSESGRRIVLWGSGSKGVAFLTTIPGASIVDAVVDINPFRHGYYMPHTGQRIVAPDELPTIKPDVVVVMNRVYLPEIAQSISTMGLSPEILALE